MPRCMEKKLRTSKNAKLFSPPKTGRRAAVRSIEKAAAASSPAGEARRSAYRRSEDLKTVDGQEEVNRSPADHSSQTEYWMQGRSSPG